MKRLEYLKMKVLENMNYYDYDEESNHIYVSHLSASKNIKRILHCYINDLYKEEEELENEL